MLIASEFLTMIGPDLIDGNSASTHARTRSLPGEPRLLSEDPEALIRHLLRPRRKRASASDATSAAQRDTNNHVQWMIDSIHPPL